mmetsp:Transcript_4709/g.6721  ORF Transcript_4709/g.6721 Transcript_4709/m.6721 type:complete len:215 (-) Transcript_4709:120-764(-)
MHQRKYFDAWNSVGMQSLRSVAAQPLDRAAALQIVMEPPWRSGIWHLDGTSKVSAPVESDHCRSTGHRTSLSTTTRACIYFPWIQGALFGKPMLHRPCRPWLSTGLRRGQSPRARERSRFGSWMAQDAFRSSRAALMSKRSRWTGPAKDASLQDFRAEAGKGCSAGLGTSRTDNASMKPSWELSISAAWPLTFTGSAACARRVVRMTARWSEMF